MPGVATARLNPHYTFDSFVIGKSNRLAFEAARAIAAKPGQDHNPLFLHGKSGVGKTHLLYAIGHAIAVARPGARVVLGSSERFTNEFVEGLSRGARALSTFRRKYRECDALLVDDVQFLADRRKTTQELSRIIDVLHQRAVQVVLASGENPKDLSPAERESAAGLEERLDYRRFTGSTRARIGGPAFEARAAILRMKAAADAIALPEGVAAFLATHLPSNVRVLEGALVRMAALASLRDEPLSESLAHEVFADVIPPTGRRCVEAIRDEVARLYGIPAAKLKGRDRTRKVLIARQVAIYLARNVARHTFAEIAAKFGKRSRAGAVTAERRVRALIAADPQLAQEVAALIRHLT
jgi:chromosomal replication initiator protein